MINEPKEWEPVPEPEPEDVKRQTHEPMIGWPRFERAGGWAGDDDEP